MLSPRESAPPPDTLSMDGFLDGTGFPCTGAVSSGGGIPGMLRIKNFGINIMYYLVLNLELHVN